MDKPPAQFAATKDLGAEFEETPNSGRPARMAKFCVGRLGSLRFQESGWISNSTCEKIRTPAFGLCENGCKRRMGGNTHLFNPPSRAPAVPMSRTLVAVSGSGDRKKRLLGVKSAHRQVKSSHTMLCVIIYGTPCFLVGGTASPRGKTESWH